MSVYLRPFFGCVLGICEDREREVKQERERERENEVLAAMVSGRVFVRLYTIIAV